MINVNCQRFALIAGLFLVGSVMVGVLPVDAATSGGKCLKAGIVQTTKSAKYKCTKSGAVLKWVKVASTMAVAGKVNTAGGNCFKVGDKSTVSGGYLECRTISGGTNNWFKLSSNPAAVSVPVGGDSLDACKLREARINKFQAWNIGFPRG